MYAISTLRRSILGIGLASLLLASSAAGMASAQFVPTPATADSAEGACQFPTKAGTYLRQGWQYDYSILLRNSKSETRVGVLQKNGHVLEGLSGQVIDTPLGRFKFIVGDRYNQGWLNTLAYDRPVRFSRMR